MAGSYNHLLPDYESPDGGGWSLIENMGDAYGCVEQLFWLVERGIGREAAQRLLDTEWYPMSRGEIEADSHRKFVDKQMSQ